MVRGASGELVALEDNLRTPSGMTYASAARKAVDRALPFAPPEGRLDPERGFELLAESLRRAAPGGDGDPSIALLTDGPSNSAWYEHRLLGRHLRIPLVSRRDLHLRGGRLHAVLPGSRSREIQVLYRRTDEDRLRDERGRATWLADGLLEPVRKGRLTVVNAFGAGVADDKAIHPHVDEMVRFYLGEDPLLPSVPSFDLSDRSSLEEVLDRLEELVVKPRTGHGGRGVVVLGQASPALRSKIAHALRAEPREWIAQETVMLQPPSDRRGRPPRAPPRGPAGVRDRTRRGARAADAGCAGGRLAYREHLPERRWQGHMGAELTGRPLIGVTTSEVRVAEKVDQTPEGEPPRREMALGLRYASAIEAAGGLPVVLPPLSLAAVEPLLDRLSGLCLSGGPDLDPTAYSERRHPRLGPTEPQLDRFELGLARAADARGLPLLAICRGAQALNVVARRHAAPAPARRRSRGLRAGAPPAPALRAGDPQREDPPREPAGTAGRARQARRQLLSPPGGVPSSGAA